MYRTVGQGHSGVQYRERRWKPLGNGPCVTASSGSGARRNSLSPMPEPTDAQVVRLLPALEEAARANTSTPQRFVPPRTGIVEQAAALRHQFIFGRRGVGKSTLLRKIESESASIHAAVVFVDAETLRGRPYPDVLIELLIEILGALNDGLKKKLGLSGAVVRFRLGRLRRALTNLLAEPQSAQRTVRRLQKKSGGGHLGIEMALPKLPFRAHGHFARAKSTEALSEAKFVESKMDGLHAAAIGIRTALSMAHERLGMPTLVVLDDFYHVPYDDQPYVLSYLHQVVKNIPIYLKICGVRHRIKPFVEGNPPTGLQVPHDAGDLSLDITLEQFLAAQTFLENVLDGVAAPAELATDELVTDTGRTRLVLASGGVARDYLDLVAKALRRANERPSSLSRPHNRITAEDVNEAAADLSTIKQTDLARDAGPETAKLRERLSDIASFCLDHNGTNVFLIEGTELQETDWGKDVQALADLRLVHELGNFSLPSAGYRGRRYVGFTLDLSNWTGTRSERIRSIPFWEPGGRNDMRRSGLIYTPEWKNGKAGVGQAGKAEPTPKRSGPVNWDEPPLFDAKTLEATRLEESDTDQSNA